VDTAPKASGCFLGGTQETFGAVSEDLLGGTGKAEDAKLPGAGIIPKQCPMERVGTEENGLKRQSSVRASTAGENKMRCSSRLAAGIAVGGIPLRLSDWIGRRETGNLFLYLRESDQLLVLHISCH
jgi:hypothetical protein